MFYECNDQCNKREVMSSDHHVIGSRFADDINLHVIGSRFAGDINIINVIIFMSSDHHVIGSRFADDINVINVTATDIPPQSICSKLPISSQFQRVKYVFGNENYDGGY